MKRLIIVEMRRFCARRSARIAGVAAILVVLTTGTVATILSNPNVSAAREARRLERAEELRACLREATAGVPQIDGKRVGVEEYCDVSYTPEAAAAERETRVRLDALDEVMLGVTGPLAILALCIGATFIGAEWSSRSMTATLAWEPRRARLLTAKALACAVVVVAGTVAFLVGMGAAISFAANVRGTTAGTGGMWLGDVVALGGRIALITGFAALVGVAFATVSRSAAAAIAAAFALLGPIEGVVRGLRPGWRSWLVGDSAGAFVAAGPGTLGRSTAAAGLLLCAYLAVLFSVALAAFRGRDVA